jgi:beta-lactamase regulating signal transducer with metallopeptidase domain
MKLYGFQGRMISLIAAIAGILSAFVAAAQAANLFSLVPEKYAWFVTAIPIFALFFTVFSERIQGGASSPEVRKAAAASDKKNAEEGK